MSDQSKIDEEVGRLLREALQQTVMGDELRWQVSSTRPEETGVMSSGYVEDGMSDRATCLLDVARAMHRQMGQLTERERRKHN